MNEARNSLNQDFATIHSRLPRERIAEFSVHYLPLDCKALDDFFGGGLPLGKLVEIYGGAGEGKTLLALQLTRLILENTDRDVVYIDSGSALTEKSLSQVVKEKLGKRFAILNIEAFETLDAALEAFFRDPKLGLVIVDALPNLRPKKDLDAPVERIHPEVRSRMVAQFLMKYKILAAESGCSLLFINELRARGQTDSDGRWLVDAAGTNAERHAMDVRISLRALPGSWKGKNMRRGVLELTAVKDRLLGNRQTVLMASYSEGIGEPGHDDC